MTIISKNEKECLKVYNAYGFRRCENGRRRFYTVVIGLEGANALIGFLQKHDISQLYFDPLEDNFNCNDWSYVTEKSDLESSNFVIFTFLDIKEGTK
jgi:hypothetical protein